MATIVAFHAHPDDEALLTGGTLARLSAEGHRVVIVVGCDGIMGDASGPGGQLRLNELRHSASILGAARVEHLGYADSGHGPHLYSDPPDRVRFVRAPIEEAARRLPDILRDEVADILISYDPQGGYGHRDHVRVHLVGAQASVLAGTPQVLQATLPREPIIWLSKVICLLRLIVRFDPEASRQSYSPRSEITHAVDVRRFALQKRRAVAAHVSQTSGSGHGARGMRVLTRLPTPVFGLLFGREWFVQWEYSPIGDTLRDVFRAT